ncbi:MAG: GNAT family N-acetyltransferase [Saprospiraceae bacterium]|nr:GNAT family N-acetyltransferase [Saprospiraceae bacterium]
MRQIRPDDQGYIFKGLSHPLVIPYYGVQFSTFEETATQMKWYADLEMENTGIWWAVCDRADGVFLGAGGLNGVDQVHRKAEIGFWLLPEHWGRGLMQEVMPLIWKYAFEHLDLHRIEGFVESENVLCKKAMAKLPFQHEGTMRDCELKNGKWISLEIYALLKE